MIIVYQNRPADCDFFFTDQKQNNNNEKKKEKKEEDCYMRKRESGIRLDRFRHRVYTHIIQRMCFIILRGAVCLLT